jgi:hypothetical protein
MDTMKTTCRNWSPGVTNSCTFGESCKFMHAGGGRSFDPPHPFVTSGAGQSNPFVSSVQPFNNPFASSNPANTNPFGASSFSSSQAWPAPTSSFNGSAFPAGSNSFTAQTAFPAMNTWNQSSNPAQAFPTNLNPAQSFPAPTSTWGQQPSGFPTIGGANPASAGFATSAWSTSFPPSAGPIPLSSFAGPNVSGVQPPNMGNAAVPQANFAAQNGISDNLIHTW